MAKAVAATMVVGQCSVAVDSALERGHFESLTGDETPVHNVGGERHVGSRVGPDA